MSILVYNFKKIAKPISVGLYFFVSLSALPAASWSGSQSTKPLIAAPQSQAQQVCTQGHKICVSDCNAFHSTKSSKQPSKTAKLHSKQCTSNCGYMLTSCQFACQQPQRCNQTCQLAENNCLQDCAGLKKSNQSNSASAQAKVIAKCKKSCQSIGETCHFYFPSN